MPDVEPTVSPSPDRALTKRHWTRWRPPAALGLAVAASACFAVADPAHAAGLDTESGSLGGSAHAAALSHTSAVGTTFPGVPVDGPSPDIQSLGGVAVARDGASGVVYVRRDGDVDHIFASLLTANGWTPPRRLDASLAGPSAQPQVAAGDQGRMAVVFVNGGTLWGSVLPATGQQFGAPVPIAPSASNPALAMAPDGAAYVSYTDPHAPAQVRVAHLDRKEAAFRVVAQALNVDPARNAGDSAAKASHVTTSADGTAIVTWGEDGGDGRVHSLARRVARLTASASFQDLTLESFDNRPGGAAEVGRVGLQDNGSVGWGVFREDFTDGAAVRSRAFARRLVGSLFDPPAPIDGLTFPTADASDPPRVALTGSGDGVAAAGLTGSHQTLAAVISQSTIAPPIRLNAANNAIAPSPVAALGVKKVGMVAWLQSTGPTDPVGLHGRALVDGTFGPELSLSLPVFGPIDPAAGLDTASDRVGDVAVAYVQGDARNRRIMVAGQNPGLASSPIHFLHTARPGLSWPASTSVPAPVSYRVDVDGVPVGTTPATQLTPAAAIRDGIHGLQVVAVGAGGQQAPVLTGLLAIDTTRPRVTASVSSVSRGTVTLSVRAVDPAPDTGTGVPSASGVAHIRVSFGDGKSAEAPAKLIHHYSHKGKFTIRVSAVDRAGNRRVARVKVKVP